MPANNEIIYHTRATNTHDDHQFWPFRVPAKAFDSGQNTIAVEVHQGTPASSDTGFDLAIHGVKENRTTIPTASFRRLKVRTYLNETSKHGLRLASIPWSRFRSKRTERPPLVVEYTYQIEGRQHTESRDIAGKTESIYEIALRLAAQQISSPLRRACHAASASLVNRSRFKSFRQRVDLSCEFLVTFGDVLRVLRTGGFEPSRSCCRLVGAQDEN